MTDKMGSKASDAKDTNDPEVGTTGSLFKVILESYGDNKIAVIRAVRGAIDGLGLADAKQLVEAAPAIVSEGMSRASAEKFRNELEAAGATATIDPLPPAFQPVHAGEVSILSVKFFEMLIKRFEVVLGAVIGRLERLAGSGDRCATDSPASDALPGDTGMKPIAHLLDHLDEMTSSVDVVLETFSSNMVACVQALLGHVPGSSLSDALAKVKGAPCIVMENAPRDAAERLKADLESAGATISIRGGFLPQDKIQISEIIKRLGDPSVDVSMSELKSLSEAIKDRSVDASEVFQLIQYKFLESIAMELKDLTGRLLERSTSTTA